MKHKWAQKMSIEIRKSEEKRIKNEISIPEAR